MGIKHVNGRVEIPIKKSGIIITALFLILIITVLVYALIFDFKGLLGTTYNYAELFFVIVALPFMIYMVYMIIKKNLRGQNSIVIDSEGITSNTATHNVANKMYWNEILDVKMKRVKLVKSVVIRYDVNKVSQRASNQYMKFLYSASQAVSGDEYHINALFMDCTIDELYQVISDNFKKHR